VTAALRLLPVALSCLLMAAHLLRSGLVVPAAACALLPLLLLVRRPWVPRVLQAALLVAAAEWIRTTLTLVRGRMTAGEPWARLAVILGAVVAVTLAAVLALRHPRLRRHGAEP
jgi:hypothetical protein